MSYYDDLIKIVDELPTYCVDFFNAKSEVLEIRTRVGYAIDLKVFFTFIAKAYKRFEGKFSEINEVDLDTLDSLYNTDIDAYISWLSKYKLNDIEYTNSAAGKKRKLATLKAFFKYLRKVGLMTNNPTEFTDIPKVKDKEIVVLSDNEQEEIIDNIINGTHKTERQLKFHERTMLRDLAIITLFLGTGIRVSELVGLNDVDIDFKEQRALVMRKGGKRQFVYFNEEVLDRLSDYMENERKSLLGYKDYDNIPDNLPLFVSLRHSRITVRMVEIIIKEYARYVLPMNIKVTPHTLRKTYGTRLYNQYRDLYLTQNALGHSSPSTTAKYYTKFNEEYLKKLKEYSPKNSD